MAAGIGPATQALVMPLISWQGQDTAWGQDQREGSVWAEGTGTLVKTNTKHKNKTLDTKNNKYI